MEIKHFLFPVGAIVSRSHETRRNQLNSRVFSLLLKIIILQQHVTEDFRGARKIKECVKGIF